MAGATKDKKLRTSEEHNRRLVYYCGLLSGSLLMASGFAGRRLFRLPGWPLMYFTTSVTGLFLAMTSFRCLYNSNCGSDNNEEENIGIGAHKLIVTSDVTLTKENVEAKDSDETKDSDGTKDSFETKDNVEVADIFKAKMKTESIDNDEVRDIVDAMDENGANRNGESIDNAKAIHNVKGRDIIEVMEDVEVTHSSEETNKVEITDNFEKVNNAVTMETVEATESSKSSKEHEENHKAKETDHVIATVDAADIIKETENVNAIVSIKVVDNIETIAKKTDTVEVASFQVVEAMKNAKVINRQQKTGTSQDMTNVEAIKRVKAVDNVEVIDNAKTVGKLGTSGKKEETDNGDTTYNVETVGNAVTMYTAESTERAKFAPDLEENENVKETDNVMDNVEATDNAEDRNIIETMENSMVPCSLNELDNFKAIASIKTMDSLEAVNNVESEGSFEVTDSFKSTSDQVVESTKIAKDTDISKETDKVEAIYIIKTVNILEAVNNVEVMDAVRVTDTVEVPEITKEESKETSEATANTEEMYNVEATKNAEVIKSLYDTDSVEEILSVETTDKAINNPEAADNPKTTYNIDVLSNVKAVDNLETTYTVRDTDNTKATESAKASDDLEDFGNPKQTDIVMENVEANDNAEYKKIVEAMENARATYSLKETDNAEARDSIKAMDNLEEVNNVERVDKVTDGAFGVRDDAFGVRDDAFGVGDDAFGARDDAFGARDDAFGARDDAFAARDDAFAVRNDNVEVMSTVEIPDNAEAFINTEYNSECPSITEDRDIVETTQNFEVTDSPNQTNNYEATVNIERPDNDKAIKFSEATDNSEETNKIDAINKLKVVDNFKIKNTIENMDCTKATEFDKDIDNVSETDNFETTDIAETNINTESKDNTEATNNAGDKGIVEAMESIGVTDRLKETDNFGATVNQEETDNVEALYNREAINNFEAVNNYKATSTVEATENIESTGDSAETDNDKKNIKEEATNNLIFNDNLETDIVKATDNLKDNINVPSMKNVEDSCITVNVGATGQVDTSEEFKATNKVKIISIVETMHKVEVMDSVKATCNDGDKFNNKFKDIVKTAGNSDAPDNFEDGYIVKEEEFVRIPDIVKIEEWYTVKAKEKVGTTDDIGDELIFEARDKESQIEQELKKTSEKYINESKRSEVNTFLFINEQHLKTKGSHVTEIPNQCISNSNDDLSFITPNKSSGIGVHFRKSSSTRLSAEFSNTVFSNEKDNHFSNSFAVANDVNVTSYTNLSETASRFQDTDTWLTTNVSGSYANVLTHCSPVSSPDTDRITSRNELLNFLDQNMETSQYSNDNTADGGIILGPRQTKGVSNSPVVYFKNQTCDSAVISGQSLRNTSSIANSLTQRHKTEPGILVLSNISSDIRKNIFKPIHSVPDISSRSSEITCLETEKKATENKHYSIVSTDLHSPNSSNIPRLSPSVKSQKSCIEDTIYSPGKSNVAFSQSPRSPTKVVSNDCTISPKFDDVGSHFRHQNSTKYQSFQSTSPNSPAFPRNTQYLEADDSFVHKTHSTTILHGSSLQSSPTGSLRSHDKKYFWATEDASVLPRGRNSSQLVDDEILLKPKLYSPTLVDTDCIHHSKSLNMNTVSSNTHGNYFMQNRHSPSSEFLQSGSPTNSHVKNSPNLEHDESHHRFRQIMRSPVGGGRHARRSTWNDSAMFSRQSHNKGIANSANPSTTTSTEDMFSTATNSPWASSDDISQYKTPYGKDIYSLARHSPWKSCGDISCQSQRRRTNVSDEFSQARSSPWVSGRDTVFQANRSPQRRLTFGHPLEWLREELGINTPRNRHYSSPSINVEAQKMQPQRLSSSLTSLDRSVSVSSPPRDAEEIQPQRDSRSLTSLGRSVNDSFADHLEVSSASQDKDSMVEEFLSI